MYNLYPVIFRQKGAGPVGASNHFTISFDGQPLRRERQKIYKPFERHLLWQLPVFAVYSHTQN